MIRRVRESRALVTSRGDVCVSVWDMHAHVCVPDSMLCGLRVYLSLWVWSGLACASGVSPLAF